MEKTYVVNISCLSGLIECLPYDGIAQQAQFLVTLRGFSVPATYRTITLQARCFILNIILLFSVNLMFKK
jgi:hypothetical protein